MLSQTRDITRTLDEQSAQDQGGQPQLVLLVEAGRPVGGAVQIGLGQSSHLTLGRGSEFELTRDVAEGSQSLRLSLPDGWMSSRHAEVRGGENGWELVDEGSRNGCWVNGRPVDRARLNDGDLVETGRTFLLFRASDPVFPPAARAELPGLVTLVPAYRQQLVALLRLAPSTVSVLLLGETGTGKEVLARALHACSERTGPFVPVNCGALPASMVEAELFGSKKGAFSGSTEDRPGLVRSAHQGTLFLDEVGDLPAAAQRTLLRVLQESEVLPIGASRPVPVDLRVVAATHRDLSQMVQAGDFRADLLARLNGFTLRLPPLRERRADLGLLIDAVLARLPAARNGRPSFSAQAARALLLHDWPRNVRELEKCLQTATVLSAGERIELAHLPEVVRGVLGGEAGGAPRGPGGAETPPLSPEDQEIRRRLVAALGEHQGNISAVARTLGKAREQIHRWMRRLAVDPESFRR